MANLLDFNRPKPALTLPPGATAIYSTSRANGWTGQCLRVKRASDSAQQDIGFNDAGFLDMAAAIAFRGASTLTVVTWYDQSGNANDATGTTPILRQENAMGALQPITCNPASGSNGSAFLTIPNGVAVDRQAYTAVAVLAPGGGVANSWGHFALGTSGTLTSNVNVLYDDTTNASAAEYVLDAAFNNTSRKNFSIPIGIPSSVIVRSDATNGKLRLNGIEASWAAAASLTLTGGYIGKSAWASAAIGCCEFFMLAIYGSTFTATQCQQVEAALHSIYGVVLNRSGIVVFDGDSISAGLNGSGYLLNLPRQTYPLVNNNYFLQNKLMKNGRE